MHPFIVLQASNSQPCILGGNWFATGDLYMSAPLSVLGLLSALVPTRVSFHGALILSAVFHWCLHYKSARLVMREQCSFSSFICQVENWTVSSLLQTGVILSYWLYMNWVQVLLLCEKMLWVSECGLRQKQFCRGGRQCESLEPVFMNAHMYSGHAQAHRECTSSIIKWFPVA